MPFLNLALLLKMIVTWLNKNDEENALLEIVHLITKVRNCL